MGNFDDLYPGAFLKSGQLIGKHFTGTITAIRLEKLASLDPNKKPQSKAIVAFAEIDQEWVMVKTNGLCLRAMFGDDWEKWIGHKVTLFAANDTSGLSESGKALRVKGSPELTEPLKFELRLARKRPLAVTLVPTGTNGQPAYAPQTAEDRPPAYDTATGEVLGSAAPIATDANGEVIDESGPTRNEAEMGFGDLPEEDVPGAGAEDGDQAIDEAIGPSDDMAGMHDASNPARGEPVTTGEPCTEKQRKLVYAKSKAAGVDDDSLHQIIRIAGGVESSRDLPFDRVDDVLTAIASWKPTQETMAS